MFNDWTEVIAKTIEDIMSKKIKTRKPVNARTPQLVKRMILNCQRGLYHNKSLSLSKRIDVWLKQWKLPIRR